MQNNLAKLQGELKLQGKFIIGNNLPHPDLTNWLNRLKYYNLPLPNKNVISAVSQLCFDLSHTNLRQKIKRLNLFCAGDWIGSFFPIIIDVGNMWDYNANFGTTVNDLRNGYIRPTDWSITSGYNFIYNNNFWSGSDPGVNGSLNTVPLKIIDTTFPENDISLSNNSVHLACYISDINNTSQISPYCTDIGGDATYFNFQCAYNGNSADNNIVRFNCYSQSTTDTAGGSLQTNTFSPQGFYIGSRVSTTLNTIYKAGYYQNLAIQLNGGYNPNYSQMVSTAPTNSSTLILGGKTNGVNQLPGSNRNVNNVTDRTYSMYSIGTGLSDTDALNYNNIIANFNSAIGRTNY
jgi:hypothetical protein